MRYRKRDAAFFLLTFRKVWFLGDHGDVGGGHQNVDLSDISLMWIAVSFFLQSTSRISFLSNLINIYVGKTE